MAPAQGWHAKSWSVPHFLMKFKLWTTRVAHYVTLKCWLCTYDWCYLRAQQEPSVTFYYDTVKQTNCFIFKCYQLCYTIHLIYIREYTTNLTTNKDQADRQIKVESWMEQDLSGHLQLPRPSVRTATLPAHGLRWRQNRIYFQWPQSRHGTGQSKWI